MNDDLKKAISCLVIQSVTLRDMLTTTYEDFDPDFLPEDFGLNGQTFQGVKKIQVFEEDDQPDEIIRFHFTSGIRFVSTSDREAYDAGEIEESDITPYIEMKATFVVDYKSQDNLTQEELKAFSKQHVAFHAWPYWREFIQSTCARLGISPIALPALRIKSD
ncbi:TPA: hypothetical protein P0E31_001213 [Vibrio campbellii]|nr:hypothetical protein [Vibrio campbellii]